MNNKKVLLTNAALWAAYDGLTSLYLTAFALALGANNITVGILSALPFLASIIAQIPGAELVSHFPRRLIYPLFSGIGRLFWFPILASPFIFFQPLPFVIFFFLCSRICESLTEPAATTLIADAVSVEQRGSFTSIRLRLLGGFGIAAMSLGGLWLKQYPKESPIGFAGMFGFAVILGIASSFVMFRIKEPRYPDHNHHKISEFFTLEGPLRRFVLFAVAFNFAFMLASPFFAVYMLKNLGISYEYFGIVTSITVLAQIITSGFIGRLADKYGDKPIAILGVLGTTLVPLAFLGITTKNLWLLIPAQLLSGVVWAAADISRFNLLLDLTDPKKRAIQIAEYNLYANIPLIIAPILGGWLSENAALVLTGIPLIFVLSSVLRLISAIFLFGIKEPRSKQEYSATYVLREAMHFHPNRGIVSGITVVRRIASGLLR